MRSRGFEDYLQSHASYSRDRQRSLYSCIGSFRGHSISQFSFIRHKDRDEQLSIKREIYRINHRKKVFRNSMKEEAISLNIL